MRNFDFSKLGGMPWYQNQFDAMQKAYQEPIAALTALGGSVPCIVYGVEETAPGSGIYTNGAIIYGGEIIPFTGGTAAATIVIDTYTTTLVYADGLTKQMYTRKAATFGTGAVQINLVDLKLYHEAFGASARTGWIELLNTADSSLVCQLDKMTNTVSVRGWVKHIQLASTTGETWAQILGPDIFLPVGMRPTNTAPGTWGLQFPTIVQKSGSGGYISVIRDANDNVYESGIITVGGNGQVLFIGRKLAIGTPLPTHIVNFSFQI